MSYLKSKMSDMTIFYYFESRSRRLGRYGRCSLNSAPLGFMFFRQENNSGDLSGHNERGPMLWHQGLAVAEVKTATPCSTWLLNTIL